jgi:hypothetical protein
MSTFATFNQFDKRFNDFEKFGSDRSACPLFGLITCYNFMMNGDLSQKQHESNVYASVTNYMMGNVPKYMTFEELLVLTGGTIESSNIGATTPELISSGILGYESLFKFGYEQDYCVLFLKNRNYIAVLCKGTPNDKYAVRDCHENTQHTFDDFHSLSVFLNNTYQFEQPTIVGGVLIPEFSNIEYVVMDFPFLLEGVDVSLIDETIEEDKSFTPDLQINTSSLPAPETTFNADDELAFALGMGDGADYVDFV